jgi:matrixin
MSRGTVTRTLRPIAAWLVAATLTTAAAGGAASRWPKGETIRLWVDPRHAPVGGEALVHRAMQTWVEASDGRLAFAREPRQHEATLRVRFITNRDGLYGGTAPHVDPQSGWMASADIMIARDAATSALDRNIIIYLTALHEIGHALGLQHTNDFSTIMYEFSRPDDGERYFSGYRARLRSADDIGSANATGLSPKDVDILRELYDR